MPKVGKKKYKYNAAGKAAAKKARAILNRKKKK